MSIASKQTEVKYLKTGKRGMLPYPAGEWTTDATYTATENVAPYVLRNGTYYVMNKVGSVKGLDPQTDYGTNGQQATWIPFEEYKAVYVELLMARLGLIGKSVFWDNYTFSQKGVDDKGQLSDQYQNFESGTFTPNILIDWVEGTMKLLKLVAEGADISGTIKAVAGMIGNFEIHDNRLGINYDDSSANGMFLYDSMIGFRNGSRSVLLGLLNSLGLKMLGQMTDTESSAAEKYGLVVNVRNGGFSNEENSALTLLGGYISGFGVCPKIIQSSTTIDSATNAVICINSTEITLTLPAQQPWQNGRIVWFRNVNGKKVFVRPGSGDVIQHSRGTLVGNNGTLPLEAEGDGFALMYIWGLSFNNSNGTWLCFKAPRDW